MHGHEFSLFVEFSKFRVSNFMQSTKIYGQESGEQQVKCRGKKGKTDPVEENIAVRYQQR
jgi:hypothetical protein